MEITLFLYNMEGSFDLNGILHRIIGLNSFISIMNSGIEEDPAKFEVTFQNVVCKLYWGNYIIELDGDVVSGLTLIEDIFNNSEFKSKLYLNTHGTIIPSPEYEISPPFTARKLAGHIDEINQYKLVTKLFDDKE